MIRKSSNHSDIKANDKVVCIDAIDYGYNRHDFPKGFLQRGRIYCVAGLCKNGGVAIVGLPCLWKKDQTESGFNSNRFCTLDQFRLNFPEGVSSIADYDDDLSYLDKGNAKLKKRIEFLEIEGMEEPKPLVCRVIEVLEELYVEFHNPEITQPWMESSYVQDQSPEHVETELRSLLRSPLRSAYMNQSLTFWHVLLRQSKPTVLFCRERSPIANLLFQMCMRGNILSDRFLDGDFIERDFPVLTCAAGALSNAPIRICDARDPDTFLRVLFEAHKSLEYAMCDWTLTGEEMAAAYRMTKDSNVTFLCPC
jgi:hypothetical protein